MADVSVKTSPLGASTNRSGAEEIFLELQRRGYGLGVELANSAARDWQEMPGHRRRDAR